MSGAEQTLTGKADDRRLPVGSGDRTVRVLTDGMQQFPVCNFSPFWQECALGRTCEEEVPLGGLLPLLQTGVEETQELQDPLLSPRLREAGVVHHQVRVDLPVVAPDVESTRCCVVLLNNFHPGHEPGQSTEKNPS